jgi:hypothetical protein
MLNLIRTKQILQDLELLIQDTKSRSKAGDGVHTINNLYLASNERLYVKLKAEYEDALVLQEHEDGPKSKELL